MIAFRILAGYPPFRARSKEEMIRVTLKGRIQFHEEHWVKISNSGKSLWLIMQISVGKIDMLTE